MATTWDSFLPYVQPYVPGCPEVTITAHLQEAASDFCARSHVWRYDLLEDVTSNTISDYELDLPTGSALEDIQALYIDGVLARRVSAAYYSLSGLFSNARPTMFSVQPGGKVRFYPTPDGRYAYDGVAVLKPALSATSVEDFLFNDHGRAIADGAIAKLAAIPGKEWSDAGLSAVYAARFFKACDDARGRDFHSGGTRVSPRGFDAATPRKLY